MSRPGVSSDHLSIRELIAAAALSASGFIFVSLVLGNYLVFSSSLSSEALGTYLLVPVYSLSVFVLHIYPFDEGLWAFAALCSLLLSLTTLRARKRGFGGSVLDTLTLFAPAILVVFEIGVFFLIPAYFFSQVTNFVARAGLGGVLTNWLVLVLSGSVLAVRLGLRRVRARRVSS